MTVCGKPGANPSVAFLPRYALTARSRPSPSIFGALTRQFAGRLLRGARELRVIRFREPCVSVLVQRDAPELPYETSSVGLDLRFDPDGQVYTSNQICRWVSKMKRAYF